MKERKMQAKRIHLFFILAAAMLMMIALSASVFADTDNPGKNGNATRHVIVESTYTAVGSTERTVGTDGGTIKVSSANGATFEEKIDGCKFEADVEVGDTVTVTGTPAEGYRFMGVHKNSTVTESMENPFSFVVEEGDQYLEYDMNFKKDFVVLTIKWSSMDGETPLNDLVYEIPKGGCLEVNQSTYVNNYFIKEGYSPYDIDYLSPQPITAYSDNASVAAEHVWIRDDLDSNTTLYYFMCPEAKTGSFTVERPICGTEVATTSTGTGTEQTNPPALSAKEGSQLVVSNGTSYWKTEDNNYFDGTIVGGTPYKATTEIEPAFGYVAPSTTPSVTVDNADEGSVALNGALSFTVTADHNWDAGTVTKKATVTEEGEMTYHCTVENCTATKTEVIPKKNPTSIAKATVSGLKAKTWTGKALKQSPTVKQSGKTLKNGTDYTITYKNNKNVGKATMTITGKGEYTGTITKSFKINPKGTSISKVTKAKKAVTVKWKKQAKKMSASRITGYQIQVATNKAFTKDKKTVNVKGYSKTSKKVAKLKAKKKYYVKIRTYKTVSGAKYYSPWSKVITVKTR